MYKLYFTGLKTSKNAVVLAANATLTCVKDKLNTDRKIVMKLAIAGKAKENKVEDGKATTYQAEAASLFGWKI